MPRRISVISLTNSFLDLKFEIFEAAENSRYVDNIDLWLVKVGLVALFSNHKLTTSSGKHLEDMNHADVVTQVYKKITSAKSADDLFVRFDRNWNRQRQELTKNKNTKGKYHVWFMLKDVSAFAEHQIKATIGLG